MSGPDGVRRIAWRLRGRVQGVGFRHYTCRVADALGVEGRVWNRPDGSVEVQARGRAAALAAFEHRLRQGPPAARVSEMESVPVGPEADAPAFRVADGLGHE